ncbi:MAG: hypothetical protein B6I20_05575 [Bacteroidetes bacterium 4572_117]|nr:MAG: hypothetical protein B6I20_05575 [Bacteroidetes bacterium 4572_117]
MTINTKEYAWADVDIVLFGRSVTGARGVKFKSSQEKEVIHASGNEPVGIGHGNKTYEGELTLLQSEVEALTIAAGTGNDIIDLPAFNIVVAFAPKLGDTKSIYTIKFAEFTEVERAMNQNDKFAEITLPFIALGIDRV